MNKNHKNLDEIIDRLPRHSYSVNGKQMEPITLIISGNKKSVQKGLVDGGWYLADSINLISTIRSAIVTLLNRSYRNGPMWPSYINGRRHQMGFERPTRSDTYRRRHHLRLWRTNLSLSNKPVWVGTLSYDKSVGRFKGSLLPTHHIASKLKSEENFLARTLRIPRPNYLKIAHRELGHINTGDPYIWDGKALVLDLGK